MIYQMVPHSMALNDPHPRFQGRAIIRRLRLPERYKIGPLLLWNA